MTPQENDTRSLSPRRKWGVLRVGSIELQGIIDKSTHVAQVLRNFGLSNNTGNSRTFWKMVDIYNLKASHFHRGKGSPLPKTDEHKAKLSAAKLKKYNVTAVEAEAKAKLGLRWCFRHADFIDEKEFRPKRFSCRKCHAELAFERLHGLKYSWYEERFEAQKGKCFICEQEPDNRGLFLDHDHACCPGGKSCPNCARGLICGKCNSLIGWLECNRNLIEKVEKYLTNHLTSGRS